MHALVAAVTIFRQVTDSQQAALRYEAIHQPLYTTTGYPLHRSPPSWVLCTKIGNTHRKSGVYFCMRSATGAWDSDDYIVWVGLAYYCSQDNSWKEVDKERRHKRRRIKITAWDMNTGNLGRRVIL